MRFNFGDNWKKYSKHINDGHLKASMKEMKYFSEVDIPDHIDPPKTEKNRVCE